MAKKPFRAYMVQPTLAAGARVRGADLSYAVGDLGDDEPEGSDNEAHPPGADPPRIPGRNLQFLWSRRNKGEEK